MFAMYILQIKVSDETYFCLKTAIWYAIFHNMCNIIKSGATKNTTEQKGQILTNILIKTNGCRRIDKLK